MRKTSANHKPCVIASDLRERSNLFKKIASGASRPRNDTAQRFGLAMTAVLLFLMIAGNAVSGYAAPPTSQDQTAYIETNAATTITLKVTDDADINNLTFTLDTLPLKGALASYTGSNHSIKYTPVHDDYANTYTFKYHVTDTEGQDSPQAIVTLVITKAVIISAGPDQIDIPAIKSTSEPIGIQLQGSASDPDNYPNPLTATWSIVRKPTGAIVEFNDINSPNTNVSFSQTGYYTLQLTVTDGAFTKTDSVSIRVKGDSDADTPTNQPPVVKDQKARVRYTSNPYSIVLSADDPNEDPLTLEIISPPQHGSLAQVPSTHVYASSSFFIPYTPYSGYIGTDSFTFKVKDDGNPALESSVATMTLDVKPWEPPIGIPEPEFGIKETHRMYAGQTFDYSQGGTVNDPRGIALYGDARNGPYTHYIDNTHPQATDDSSNPYGTPAKPRLTIPINLPAGSVVEVHGGPYTSNDPNHPITLDFTGSVDRPIFIRGAPYDRPTFGVGDGIPKSAIRIMNSYVIIENINFEGCLIRWDQTAHHVALRHSEVTRTESTSVGMRGDWPYEGQAHHVVIYNNYIHDNGDYLSNEDLDYHGISTGQVHHLWALDNHLCHLAGNGIQSYHSGWTAGTFWTHHIYIGRNEIHANNQAGIGIKRAQDVVISENASYDSFERTERGQWGNTIGLQYEHDRVWILYNHLYNSQYGIVEGMVDTDNDNVYIVGNLIQNIHRKNPADSMMGWIPSEGAAISIRSLHHIYIANNTIANIDGGIYVERWHAGEVREVSICNNIISYVGDGYYISIQDQQMGVVLRNNLLYEEGGSALIRWKGYSDTYDIGMFKATFPGIADDSFELEPGFIDLVGENFHLLDTSRAINTGMESDIYDRFYDLYGIDIAKDIAGTARPQGPAFDIGAYEYVPDEGEPAIGDITGNGGAPDGKVDVLDLQACVNIILGVDTDFGDIERARRVMDPPSAGVNVTHLQAIVNRILGV